MVEFIGAALLITQEAKMGRIGLTGSEAGVCGGGRSMLLGGTTKTQNLLLTKKKMNGLVSVEK
jgi:hypothetical protein